MEVLVSNKSPDVEESRVSPIRSREEIN